MKKVLRLASAMECADGDKKDLVYWNALAVVNKIVFTSPEAMVEFAGEKIKPRRLSKPFGHIQIYIHLKGQLGDLFSFALGNQKSPIANHVTTLCKVCEIKSLTTQALSQL